MQDIDGQLKELFASLAGPATPIRRERRAFLRRPLVLAAAAVVLGATAAGVAAGIVLTRATGVVHGVGCSATPLEYNGSLYEASATGPEDDFTIGRVIGEGRTVACPGPTLVRPNGSTTTLYPGTKSYTVKIRAIVGVRPTLAVMVDAPEAIASGFYILPTRCLFLHQGRSYTPCLHQYVRFHGRTYAPTNPFRPKTTPGAVAGTAQLTDGGRKSKVPIRELQGIPTTTAVFVPRLPDRIFLADDACNTSESLRTCLKPSS